MHHHSAKGLFEGSFRVLRDDVVRYKEGTNWWQVQDGHWCRSINLDIKCCTRSRPGVVLGQGYNYKPLMSVIGIKHLHNKTSPVTNIESFSRVVEFFERSHRSVDLCKYQQPCIMSSIMRWIYIVMQVVLLPCLVSCGGFKLGSRGFPVGSWAMR
jgi:hypothetical protein